MSDLKWGEGNSEESELLTVSRKAEVKVQVKSGKEGLKDTLQKQ